ncbi:MAG: hypothetical protein JSS08_07715 [Proteobacteria bacterium]|nr:hypothetical protein [Pseudomonadota bacterium]
MRQRPLDELLFHWRAVIGAAPEGFPRDFALSIQKQRRRPGWEPTDRQMAIMRRMVAELFTQMDVGEVQLIEGGA